jgi:hypothetical protein
MNLAGVDQHQPQFRTEAGLQINVLPEHVVKHLLAFLNLGIQVDPLGPGDLLAAECQ